MFNYEIENFVQKKSGIVKKYKFCQKKGLTKKKYLGFDKRQKFNHDKNRSFTKSKFKQ
jgi:hypothetical protein